MGTPKYEKIMEPLVIRGRVLKNRLEASNSLPHFLQGPEPYPADTVIAHFENKAKSAAIVTCMGINNGTRGKQLPMFIDFGHFPDFDLYDPCCQNYLLQLADAIHYHHSLACMALFAGPPSQYPLMKYKHKVTRNKADDVYDSMDQEEKGMINDGPPMDEFEIEEIPAHLAPDMYTEEMLDKIAESLAEQAYLLQKLDFDMVSIHMSYRASAMAMFFSPITNNRKDQWGGTYDNRKKFPLMVLKRIRERVGNQMIIELQWTGDESSMGGYDLDETVRFLNEAKQYIDIVQVRAHEVDPSHPTGFTLEETPFVNQAAYIKERVDGLIVATIGGNFYADTCEEILATHKADIISGARCFISNPEYGQMIKEGRADDIVPCLRCNKCHGRGPEDPFQSVCSVNPLIGMEQKVERMVRKVDKVKKVAIIGGGPAGMRCALYLKERGHTPVIYEAANELGGAIKHSDYVDFKWPLKRFKDYLIYQIEKQEIEVRKNTYATPEMIKQEAYDVVINAIGATPIVPNIKGAKEITPLFYEQAFQEFDKIGKKVAIIGGGEVGVELGIYLAQKGIEANVFEMRKRLAQDATVMHYLSALRSAWEKEELFHGLTSCKVVELQEGKIIYENEKKEKEEMEVDSIIFCCGMQSRIMEGIQFYGCATEYYTIGDCERPATIQQAMRSAFSTANCI